MRVGDLFRLAFTPGVFVHEWFHAVVGWLLGADVAVSTSGWGGVTELSWPAGAPRWRVRVAHLAPTLAAAAWVLVALTYLSVVGLGGWLGTPLGLLTAAYGSVQFWLVAYPSEDDRRPFPDAR